MQELFKSLTEEIKKHDTIYLMAHRNIDLDAFGSLLCMYEIIMSFNKEAYIIMNKEVNSSVSKAISKVENINYKYSNRNIDENALLIVIDTHKKEMVEIPSLIDKVKNVIVLDHHIKDTDYIKNTIVSYINSSLSSTVEIMINYLKYLNKVINPMISTIMLAGLEIDTNNFNIKTTDKTYEIAASLYKLGADGLIKNELLKENKEEYFKRQKLIESAKMISDNIALCVFDDDSYSKEALVIVATDLLQFENVEVGLALGKLKNGNIGISAKSLGNINVEDLMKKLGGGGHFNNAATEIKDKTKKEVEKMLISAIKE